MDGNHVSIPAREPQHVAEVLAELMKGKCVPFGPLEGAFMAVSGDANGTLLEIYPERTTLNLPDAVTQRFQRKRIRLHLKPSCLERAGFLDRGTTAQHHRCLRVRRRFFAAVSAALPISAIRNFLGFSHYRHRSVDFLRS
jgi:hypothetical protein